MVELSGASLPFPSSGLASSIASLESLLSSNSEPNQATQKFLRFRLSQDTAVLVAVDDIAAVLTVAVSEILPVPDMSACVLGVYNWRGEALWLVDLANQTGFMPITEQSQRLRTLMTIVIQPGESSLKGTRNQVLGLAIPEVYEIEQHSPENFRSPSSDLFDSAFLPFIKGYFIDDSLDTSQSGRSVVLDASAVLQDSCLHIHHQSKF